MRRRLVLAIAGVASAAVLLFALPLAVALHRSHRDEELLRLQRDTVAATRQIDVTAGRRDPIELPERDARLVVYDRAGARVAGRGPVRAPGLVRDALRSGRPVTTTEGGRLAAAVPLLSRERVAGAVSASRAGAVLARRDRRAWLRLGALALAVVGLAVGAALVLGRRLAGPLERLAGAARRLGEGDFSVRSPRAGVAELDAVGDALDATAARLDELIARERSFTADASHQLRTPLAALRLEIEALELRGGSSAEVTAALAQVDRLQSTIETLLSVARDAPRGGGRADLVELVDEAEGRWRSELATDGRALRTAVGAGPREAGADAGVVAEVLDVLLDNANRHGEGAVTVSLRDADGWLAIDVEDEGGGLAGDADQAFVRRSGSDGHGIGLALARSLAAAEGGQLTVTRARPRPRFTLLLPGSSD